MRRIATHLWIQLILFLVLATINVPPWLIFKGNTIASVCAFDVSVAGNDPRTVVVESAVQNQDDEHDDQTRQSQARVEGYQQQHQQRPLGFVKSDPTLDPTPLSDLQGRIVTTDPDLNVHSGGEDTKREARDAQQTPLETPSPPNPDTHSPDDSSPPSVTEQPPLSSPPVDTSPIRRLTNTYYARLSAIPGTEEAKAQHVLVREALLALPGRVTIRHEFGTDEDDVLNVISFKLEGNRDGLEEIAALAGVIGIYPVVSDLDKLWLYSTDLLVWFCCRCVFHFSNHFEAP